MFDPFDTLGIPPHFDIDLAAVEQRYRDLSRVLHPDKHIGAAPTERRMALGRAVEVNEAWRLVRDPIRRAEALLRRGGVDVREGEEPRASPEFLMDMMDQREALAAAKAEHDREGAARLGSDIRARESAVLGRLSKGFDGPRDLRESSAANLAALLPLLGELRYYRRFLDELGAIEDET